MSDMFASMDDMVALGSEKEELHMVRREVEIYLNKKLHLNLKRIIRCFRPLCEA